MIIFKIDIRQFGHFDPLCAAIIDIEIQMEDKTQLPILFCIDDMQLIQINDFKFLHSNCKVIVKYKYIICHS